MLKIQKVRAANFATLLDIYDTNLTGLAEKLDCSISAVSQLFGKKPVRSIGERRARSIEEKLGLVPGWLDVERK